ncbi:MAG: SusC/RagA family TonB-linked outer membrane protein [Bacteroidota bacterium]
MATTPLALAQSFDIQGQVVDASTGLPLAGINVVEVGTQTGTSTDGEGAFSLTVSGPNAMLAVSGLGYVRQEVAVASRSTLTVELMEDTALMDDVVVTALGIERQERAIGYAVEELDGESLREVRETNVANALAGRVAGVIVSKPASGPAGSSRVVIRGINALGGNGQPLYVVDGVPIDNTTISSAGEWGGVDGGDGISGINPDDIESLTVLKSAAASALYGSRAQNGVILITTKQATRDPGIGLEINSNTTFDNVLVATDFQDIYGQGTRGEKPANADAARQSMLTAWGPRLDGSEVIGPDGQMRPFSLVDNNNILDFYETGLTTTNTVALTATTETAAVRLSGSFLDNDGVSPTSGLQRATFNLRGTADFGSRLSADAKLNFIREDVFNRPRLSDSPGNANFSVFLLAPNVDVNDYQCPGGGSDCEVQGSTEAGTENGLFDNIFVTNPYWAATQFEASDDERRLIGTASLTYEFTDWLSLQGRFGGDTYTLRRTNIEPFGTAYIPGGAQSEQNFSISEINTDFLFFAQRDLTDDLSINANLGGNILFQDSETLTLGGRDFSIPGLEVVTNQGQTNIGFGVSQRQVNSLYGLAEFGYRDYLFLTATARNDWFSTLNPEDNSVLYPSLSGSFVFSEAFSMPSWLSFGKVRASYANVGGDTDPYQLSLTYSLAGNSHLGQPRGGVAQNAIPLATLRPSNTVEYEAGFDIRGFDNRLGLDLTYYTKTTEDQILRVNIPQTTGFAQQIINDGEIRNSGVELLLSTTPLLTSDFRWDLNFNYANNDNEVVALTEGVETFQLGTSRFGGPGTVVITADVGEPFGAINGFPYLRDDQGRVVFDDDGLPLRGEKTILGNALPDWIGGISNTFRYKRLTLSGLVDIRVGGDVFSALNANAFGAGLHRETLPGRDVGSITGEGVSRSSCTEGEDADGNLTLSGCAANTTAAEPQDYYGRIAGQISEEFVYDASFVKLREINVGYRIPESLFAGTPIQFATISFVARNLWLISSNIPNLDPESSYRNDNNGIGLELAGVPQTRSFGFNLNVRL